MVLRLLDISFMSGLGEKLYRNDKKIIALNGFDDQYNEFGYKDLSEELPQLNLKL